MASGKEKLEGSLQGNCTLLCIYQAVYIVHTVLHLTQRCACCVLVRVLNKDLGDHGSNPLRRESHWVTSHHLTGLLWIKVGAENHEHDLEMGYKLCIITLLEKWNLSRNGYQIQLTSCFHGILLFTTSYLTGWDLSYTFRENKLKSSQQLPNGGVKPDNVWTTPVCDWQLVLHYA